MLSIGLSLNDGLRSLERALKMRLEGMGKALLEGVYTEEATSVAASTTAAPETPGLRIARTTLPDRQLDFNETFRHIYQELKPGSLAAPAEKLSRTELSRQQNKINEFVRRPLAASAPIGDRNPHRAAAGLKVARTTLPDQQLDFNQTFRHIHMELKASYQRANAQGR
jgi:hypothetical protein